MDVGWSHLTKREVCVCIVLCSVRQEGGNTTERWRGVLGVVLGGGRVQRADVLPPPAASTQSDKSATTQNGNIYRFLSHEFDLFIYFHR